VYVSLAVGFVFFSGCQQDRNKARQAGTESADAGMVPIEEVQEDQDAAEAATVSALREKVDTEDAPEYLKKLVGHLNEIIRLTRENLNDCAKAEEQLSGYLKSNQEEMTALSQTMEAATKKMADPNDPNKLRLAKQLISLMVPTVDEIQKVMSEFSQKCPTQAAVVGEAMRSLKAK